MFGGMGGTNIHGGAHHDDGDESGPFSLSRFGAHRRGRAPEPGRGARRTSGPGAPPGRPDVPIIRAAATQIAAGWMCTREAGGIRYGRVVRPGPEMHGFSVDVVDMEDCAGPHHIHPNGEIDLVMPIEGPAVFDGSRARAGRFTSRAAITFRRSGRVARWCCICCRRARSSSRACRRETDDRAARNYVCGRRAEGRGDGKTLHDPVTGAALARVSSEGVDLARAPSHTRGSGAARLRALSYAERATMLGEIAKMLQANRDAYFEIAIANSGTTRSDSAIDIDGSIYTLGQYGRWGAALGETRALAEGGRQARQGWSFQSQHVLLPVRGVALLINAFNFPAWGLWEKVAAALLSGVPVIAKPATATAWLAQRMVADVVEAGILPEGALSIVCGGGAGLLDQLRPFDVVSFTGSGATAERSAGMAHTAQLGARERRSRQPEQRALASGRGRRFARLRLAGSGGRSRDGDQVGPEMHGDPTGAVPDALFETGRRRDRREARSITVGNPRNEKVRMGSLVSRAQLDAVTAGIAQLRSEAEVIHDGAAHPLVDADPTVAACVGPTLLGTGQPDRASLRHTRSRFSVRLRR